MRKFKAGEKARYVGYRDTCNPFCTPYLQQEVTVVGPYPIQWNSSINYTVQASDGFQFGVAEQSLRKPLPDSDSYQRGSWDEFHRIINQPAGVTNHE